jgi:hypothetical protein
MLREEVFGERCEKDLASPRHGVGKNLSRREHHTKTQNLLWAC